MARNSFLGRISLNATGTAFQQEKIHMLLRLLFVTSIIILTIETLIMLVLDVILELPHAKLVSLDGLFLVLFLFPLNYFFIIQPLSEQIQEHYQTNQELRKSNEIFERFFSISGVLIAYMDANFNFIRVNQAYADADQHSPSFYIGKNHFSLFPNAENVEIFKTVVKTGQAFSVVEKPFEYAENPERGVSYWDWNLLPVKNVEGQVTEVILVLNDVTSRKMAQKALVESERRFRAVFHQTFQHIGLLTPEGKTILFNQTALDFTGGTQEVVADKPLWKIPWWENISLSPEENACPLQALVQKAAGGSVVRCEKRISSASSGGAFMDISIKPLLDEKGSTVLLLYEARDITERKKSEEAIRRSEGKIKRLYELESRAHQFAEAMRSAALALSGSLDSETVFQTLLDHLFAVVPFTSAHVILLEDEEHMVFRMARGEESWEQEQRLLGKRFEISALPLFLPLLKNKQLLSVPDVLLYPGAIFQPNDMNVRCWLGIPLQAGEQTVGAFLVEHNCPGFFSDDLIQWATVLTSQASIAIQNAWLFEQVRDGREHMQALSRRLVEAQELERHHIARELHDEAGQSLTSLLVGLRLMERECSNSDALIAHCEELKQIANSVMENLHRLAADLRPASLDHLGLIPALRQHTEVISKQHYIMIQFEVVGKIDRLPAEVETAIYRIIQEALTNVIRHARASRADILLERRDNQLVVVVEDNGIGFDPQMSFVNHLGMLGMRERANMLGGMLTVESSPGKGTTVLLEVPFMC